MNDLVAVLVIVVIFVLVIIFLSSLALNSFTKVSKDEMRMRMRRNMNRNMNRNTKKSVLYPIVDPNAYWWPTNWNIPQVGPTHHNHIHPAPVPGHHGKHHGGHGKHHMV